MYDIHSHILPGVDDGPGDLKTAMSMVDAAYQQGVRHMVCTSHLNHPLDFHSGGIDRAYDLMKVNVEVKYSDMHLYKGYEIYITRKKIKALKELDLRTIEDSDYILVEFSRDISFADMVTAVQELKSLKLNVIIAHPEVYDCLRNDDQHMADLRNAGVLFQCNASSVVKEDQDLIRHWIESRLIDFIGSDAHGTLVRPNYMAEAYALIKTECGEEVAKKLFIKNAKAVLGNKPIAGGFRPVKKKRVKAGVELVFGVLAILLLSSIIYGATGSLKSEDKENEGGSSETAVIEIKQDELIAPDLEEVKVNEDLLSRLRHDVSKIKSRQYTAEPDSTPQEAVDQGGGSNKQDMVEAVGQESVAPSQNVNNTPDKVEEAEPSHEEFLVGSYVDYMEELRSLYMTIVDDYYLQLKEAVRIEDQEEREAAGKAIRAELLQMEVEVDNEVNKVLYDMQNDLEDYDYEVAVVQELRDSYYDTKADISAKYKAELEAYYEEKHHPGP